MVPFCLVGVTVPGPMFIENIRSSFLVSILFVILKLGLIFLSIIDDRLLAFFTEVVWTDSSRNFELFLKNCDVFTRTELSFLSDTSFL